MTTKNYFLQLLIAAVVFVPFAANAQITIGSGEAPQSFSVLELISDHTGLRLPQMDNAQRTAMQNTDEFQAEINGRAMGLKIFNTDMQCVQYWSGSERGWISLCDGRTTIDIDPDSPWLNRPPFTGGGFVGRTYFDISYSNTSGSCGNLGTGSRQAPYIHGFRPCFTEVYSFVGNGDILNLTFSYQNLPNDANIPVILGIAQTGNSVIVSFNPALDIEARHRHRSTAFRAVLYASFDVPGQGQRQHTFHIRVADCAPCGAYAGAGEWREFMCHNLGANTNLDPFVPHRELHGHLFRWGRSEYAVNASANIATDGVPAGWNQAPNHIGGAWDMTTRNPCPEGFRVPTQAEWNGVAARNTSISVYDSDVFLSGVNFGGALFLPATGWRANTAQPTPPGSMIGRSPHMGRYWSSTYNSTAFSYSFSFGVGVAIGSTPINAKHLSSIAVRCIAE